MTGAHANHPMDGDTPLVTPDGTRRIFTTFVAAASLLAVILFLSSNLELQTQQSTLRARVQHSSEVALPEASTLRGALLNFDTFAADLLWIQALQYFGRQQQLRRTPVDLETFADRIATLDPYFYEVYPWFAATYRGTHFPISVEDTRTMNRFLDRGIRRFPNRWRLPYKAGMNYIGYGSNRSTQQQLSDTTSAIDYLQQASALPGAPSSVPLTISWLYERRRTLHDKLDSSAPSAENAKDDDTRKIDFLTEIYFLIEDRSTRRQIRKMLSESPRGRRMLQRKIQGYASAFRAAHKRDLSFLPLDVWAWTSAQPPLTTTQPSPSDP